jgi:hypothetical protein
MPEPFNPNKPYYVQYTDEVGGEWQSDPGDFAELDSAKERAAHLLQTGKTSVRVIKVEFYDAQR